jgi:hypothetical protein
MPAVSPLCAQGARRVADAVRYVRPSCPVGERDLRILDEVASARESLTLFVIGAAVSL